MRLQSLGTTSGLMIIAACVATVLACGKSPGERIAEKAMEKAMERGGVKDADIDLKKGTFSYRTEEGDGSISFQEEGWPRDLPAAVPEFEMGKVKGVIRSEQDARKSWNMVIEAVQEGAAAKYAKVLEGKGWNILSQMTGSEGGMLQASKDDLMMVGVFNADGGGSLSIGQQ